MQETITEYDPVASGLATLRERYEGATFEVATAAGMKVAVAARAELRSLRVAVEKTRVEIKAPALERCRTIDSEAKRITTEIKSLEDPIHEQIKVEEKRKYEIREQKRRAEAERLAIIERERLAAEQAELERQRAELAAEREAQAKAARDAAEKLDAERERLAAEREAQAKAAREAREKADAEAAWERKRLAEIEAERQAQDRQRIAEEQETVRAEAARVAAAKLEAEETARREAERKAAERRVEDERREAELQAARERAEAAEVASATLLDAAREVVAAFADWGVVDQLPARKLAAAVKRAMELAA